MNFDPLSMVQAAIEAIEAPKTECEYTPSRWPYTYAYDYVRTHWRIFRLMFGGSDAWPARSDVAEVVNGFCGDDEQAHQQVLEALASAYLREHNIVRPEGS